MLFAVEGGVFFSSSASGYSKGLTLLLLGQRNKEKPMRVIPWNQYQLVEQETKPDIQLDPQKRPPVRRCAFFVCFGHDAAGHESPPTVKVELPQSQEDLPENLDSHLVDDVDGDGISSTISGIKSSLKKSVGSPRDDVNGSGSVCEVSSSSIISSLESSLKKSAGSPHDDISGNGSVNEVSSRSIISSLKSSLKKSAGSCQDDVNDNGSIHDENSSPTISSLKSSLKKSASSPRDDVSGNGSVHGVNTNEDEASYENENEITCQTHRRSVQWTDTTGGELFEIREFEMSEDSEDEFDPRTKKTCSCRIM